MILILMGVSGSGKSTLGRLLSDRLGWAFFDGDDYHPRSNVQKMSRGEPLTDEDRWPWLDALRSLISAQRRDGRSALVAASALKASYRRRLRRGSPDLRFIYLKASYEDILRRLEQRSDHFMPPGLLLSQFRALEEPQDALTLDAMLPPEELAELILKALGIAENRDVGPLQEGLDPSPSSNAPERNP